jgi:hypothetical protein
MRVEVFSDTVVWKHSACHVFAGSAPNGIKIDENLFVFGFRFFLCFCERTIEKFYSRGLNGKRKIAEKKNENQCAHGEQQSRIIPIRNNIRKIQMRR